MERVTDLKLIFDLTFKALKKGVVTNCFLTKDEYEAEIQEGNLFYEQFENNLFIIRQRDAHFILNFYINDLMPLKQNLDAIKCQIERTKGIVCELVYKNDDIIENISNIFSEAMFLDSVHRVRLVRSINDSQIFELSNNVSFAEPNHAKEIMNILKKCFDEYTGCIPTEDTLLNSINKNEFLIYKESNMILGLLEFSKDNNTLTIRHLATLEEFRNKKIASTLLQNLLNISKKSIKVWTSIDGSAINLYKRYGFIEDEFNSIVKLYEWR